MEKYWNEFIEGHFYREYFWERKTSWRKDSKETMHVSADEYEQVNRLLENLLK